MGTEPGKVCTGALHRAKFNCWQSPYVITLDIKSYFEGIPHDKLIKALQFTAKKNG